MLLNGEIGDCHLGTSVYFFLQYGCGDLSLHHSLFWGQAYHQV